MASTVGPTGIAFLSSTALGGQCQNQAFVGDINNGNLYLISLNGAPAAAGTASFTLQVTDADRASSTRKFKIKVFKALNISTNSLKSGNVNKPYSVFP